MSDQIPSALEESLMNAGILRPLSKRIADRLEVNSLTWATKPTASEFGRGQAWFSDIGAMGYSDSVNWWRQSDVKKAEIRAKAKSDFLLKKPLIQAPLWAITTAYLAGQKVRHSNGMLMTCVVNGTSGGSEPTYTITAAITDNTATWVADGIPSRVNVDGYPVPTIVSNNTAPTSAVLNALYDSTIAGSAFSGNITAGSGYVDGVYTNVQLTGGSGTGAVALSVTVSGGAVTAVTVLPAGTGTGYKYNEALSCLNTYLGGSGSGFVWTINRIWQDSKATWCLQSETVKTSNISASYSSGYMFDMGWAATPNQYGVRVIEFITDDPWPSIAYHNPLAGRRPLIWVDGYPLEEAPTAMQTSATPAHYKIDWNGHRQLRHYRVEVQSLDYVKGVYVLASSVLYAPEDKHLRGVYFGDSFHYSISSYSYNLPFPEALAQQIFRRTGIGSVRDLGIGSTGYLAGKSVPDNNVSATPFNCLANLQVNTGYNFADVDLVVFAHGLNDVTSNSVTRAAVAANAVLCWQEARLQYPMALIIVFGPWSENSGPSADNIATDTAIHDAFLTWDDAFSVYHSISQDTKGAWTTGTGKWGATTGTGNSDIYTGADGTHPTQIGKEYLIQRMVEYIDNDLKNIGI